MDRLIFPHSATADNKDDTPNAAFPSDAFNSPAGDGGGFHVAKGIMAQAGSLRLHGQADSRGVAESGGFEA